MTVKFKGVTLKIISKNFTFCMNKIIPIYDNLPPVHQNIR